LAGIFVGLEGYLKEILVNKYDYQLKPKAPFYMFEKDKLTGILGGVGNNKVRKLLLLVPPLQEQKRIVE